MSWFARLFACRNAGARYVDEGAVQQGTIGKKIICWRRREEKLENKLASSPSTTVDAELVTLSCGDMEWKTIEGPPSGQTAQRKCSIKCVTGHENLVSQGIACVNANYSSSATIR